MLYSYERNRNGVLPPACGLRSGPTCQTRGGGRGGSCGGVAPYWEYGAWIDVRDVAGAVYAALRRPELTHLTTLIVADDVTSPIPPRELARRLLPGVPWRGLEPTDEWAPLVRSDRARAALGWQPQHRWRSEN